MNRHGTRLAVVVVLFSLALGCQPVDDVVEVRPGPTRIGDLSDVAVDSPAIAAPAGKADDAAPRWRHELSFAGATYIAPHFAAMDLPAGASLRVSTPDGSRARTYERRGNQIAGSAGFWGMPMPGERAVLELYSTVAVAAGAVRLDQFAHGFAAPAPLDDDTDISICGTDDSLEAKCYATSEPTAYGRARAVSRLHIAGVSACTGWLVGSEGHLITNEHCINTASDAANTSFEFMAEGATCQSNCKQSGACPGPVVADTSQLVKVDANLDYALVKLPVNPTTDYGFLQLRPTGAVVGEQIYIPQHPAVWGKRIAMKAGALPATITTLDAPACSGTDYQDVGYMADTQGGSSGSPVLGYSDHQVVALHHCAACPNRGVPIDLVIEDLGPDLPADAVGGDTAAAAVVINEVLADPAATYDANGDGTRSSADDEFVEIVNPGTADVDLSGYALADGVATRLVFPDGTIVPGGGVLVVFGGGTPAAIPGAEILVARLALNNTGDSVTLRDADGDIVSKMTYGSEGGSDTSLVRADEGDPESGFVRHDSIAGSPASPGRRADGTAF